MTLTADAGADWSTQYALEGARLMAALRHVAEGGVIEQVAHVGATSIPGLPAPSYLEIALTMWPFPLAAPVLAQLGELGYRSLGEAGPDNSVCFQHVTGAYRLTIWMAGAEAWFDRFFIREYLCADEGARARYAAAVLAPVAEPALVTAARDWWVERQGFAPLQAIATELCDLTAPWYISSGWALDLFLGQPTRCHYDVDIVIARDDQLHLQQYLAERGWRFATYLDGRLDPWPLHMRLELPRHQVHAHRDGMLIDVLFTDIRQGIWRYRREPSIVQTTERIALQTAAGLPFLAPEIVLLFKSKTTSGQERAKDQADFEPV